MGAYDNWNYNPQTPQYTGRPLNQGSDTYAQETRAYLARQEWADYQNRYQPVEDQLINSVSNTDMLDQRLSAIRANSAQAGSAAAQASQMVQARYGVSTAPDQQSAQNLQTQLTSTKSAIDAANSTRTAVYDRNLAVMGGGSVRQSLNDTGGTTQ